MLRAKRMGREGPVAPAAPVMPAISADGRAEPDVAVVAEAMISEYECLRGEIGRFQDHQKQIMQFGFATMVGLAAALANIVSQGKDIQSPPFSGLNAFVLGAVAAVFLVLNCLYAESIHRINVPARYIHRQLRVRFRELTGADVWDWETYLAAHRKGQVQHLHHAVVHAVLDRVRWLAFVAPILLVILTFRVVPSLTGTSVGKGALVVSIGSLVGATVVMLLTTEGEHVID